MIQPDPATTGPATDSATEPTPVDWAMIGRVLLKAAVLFALLNLLFAACRPLDALGRLSAYNLLWPGRDRLPYGERPSEDYNLTLNNLPAMLGSQTAARPAAADEFRVLVIGDSGTWGWFLPSDETLAAQITALGLQTGDGRRVVAYTLGFPVLSLTKDLLILDAALPTAPDLIIWPVTLQSFARGRQLDHPLLQNNAGRLRRLIETYDLDLDPADPRLVDRSLWEETIVARRRDLADLLRLQGYGLAWAATGIDQAIPDEIPPRTTNLEADPAWLDIPAPRPLTAADLTFDVLAAGVARAGAVPVLIVNEPMFISDGANSDIRYNAFYPRWAYDDYRAQLAETTAASDWPFLDLWDAVAPERFTDTPVHLDATGTRQYAELLAPALLAAAAR
jgi:lysophospholipase L1-like esterase